MARPSLLSLHTPGALPSRVAGGLAGVCSAVLGAAAFVAAYAVVFAARIGPTAVVIDDGRGWGAHTGDVLALPLVGIGVVCLAFAVSCLSSLRPSPVPLVVRPARRR